MKNSSVMVREHRQSVIKSIKETNNLPVESIYPLYEESLFSKEFLLKGFTKTDIGVSFDIWETGFNALKLTHNVIEKAGIYMLTIKRDNKEHILYIGVSGADTNYRIYRLLKEHMNKSRLDESHPAGAKLSSFMQENNIGILDSITMYFSPVLFDGLQDKDKTFKTLTEVKMIMIDKFKPLLNHITE